MKNVNNLSMSPCSFAFKKFHISIHRCIEIFVFTCFQKKYLGSLRKYSAQVWFKHWFDHQPNDERAQQQKSGGRERMESFGGHSEGARVVVELAEWGWNKVKDGFVYQKCPLSVMKRIDKAKKEKKREKKEWKRERLINGQPQRKRAYFTLYKDRNISSLTGL